MLTTSLPFLVSLRQVGEADLLPHQYLRNYPYWLLYNYLVNSTQFILAYGDFEWDWFVNISHLLRFAASVYENGHRMSAKWHGWLDCGSTHRSPGQHG